MQWHHLAEGTTTLPLCTVESTAIENISGANYFKSWNGMEWNRLAGTGGGASQKQNSKIDGLCFLIFLI